MLRPHRRQSKHESSSHLHSANSSKPFAQVILCHCSGKAASHPKKGLCVDLLHLASCCCGLAPWLEQTEMFGTATLHNSMARPGSSRLIMFLWLPNIGELVVQLV